MLACIAAFFMTLFSSCTGENIRPLGYTGAPLVILDTDLGSSTDDLFSMQMLYRYHDKGRCKLLGVVVDRMGENKV